MADAKAFIKHVFFSIVWLALLLVVAWPLACFCAAWWVFLQPFEPLLGIVSELNAVLYKLVMWPKQLGKAILEGWEEFPNPNRQSSYASL